MAPRLRTDRPARRAPWRHARGRSVAPRPERRTRPNFTAPPELPQRPKAKRLKPGRAHRNAVLADLPEEQRAVAERALQGGIPAVRQAVNEQNARLKAEGKEEIPAAGLLSMAEQLLPKLRVAEWLDRADAAMADLDELDLRDLRSVVAAGEDPMVARDETTREIADGAEGRAGHQAGEGAGPVVRRHRRRHRRRSRHPCPQAVVAAARRPASASPPSSPASWPTATTANLTTDALPDRWVAVLEAVAFSPGPRPRSQPTAKPAQVSDELLATVKRLGSAAAADRGAVRHRGQPGRCRAQAAAPDPAHRAEEARQGPRSPRPPKPAAAPRRARAATGTGRDPHVRPGPGRASHRVRTSRRGSSRSRGHTSRRGPSRARHRGPSTSRRGSSRPPSRPATSRRRTAGSRRRQPQPRPHRSPTNRAAPSHRGRRPAAEPKS